MLEEKYKQWIREQINQQIKNKFGLLIKQPSDLMFEYSLMTDDEVISAYNADMVEQQAKDITCARDLISKGQAILAKYGVSQ